MEVTKQARTDISVVILCFNSARCINRCISSVTKALKELDLSYDIWIVDNGSTDNSRELIRKQQELDPAIHLIKLETNGGTTMPRNLALRKCRGISILVLDSDAYVTSSAVRVLLDELLATPEIGLVAPRLTFPDGRWQLSVDRFPTILRKIERFLWLRKLEHSSEPLEK
jgi:glycosyltransferase involved in cell wall biosynthesis